MNDKLKEIKKIIQTTTKHKSIKLTKDGKIEITCRFIPNKMLVDDTLSIENLKNKLCNKIENIIGCKYRIISMQKQPYFCYNVYARLLRNSSAASSDKFKKYLKYFTKVENDQFVKTSYCEITFIMMPQSKEFFLNFLSEN